MKKKIGLIVTIIGLFQINNLYSSQADLGVFIAPYVKKACEAGIEYGKECLIEEILNCNDLRSNLNRLADEYNSLGCGSSPECTENIRVRHRILRMMRDKGCLRDQGTKAIKVIAPLD